jgi:hypothetical protein
MNLTRKNKATTFQPTDENSSKLESIPRAGWGGGKSSVINLGLSLLSNNEIKLAMKKPKPYVTRLRCVCGHSVTAAFSSGKKRKEYKCNHCGQMQNVKESEALASQEPVLWV